MVLFLLVRALHSQVLHISRMVVADLVDQRVINDVVALMLMMETGV